MAELHNNSSESEIALLGQAIQEIIKKSVGAELRAISQRIETYESRMDQRFEWLKKECLGMIEEVKKDQVGGAVLSAGNEGSSLSEVEDLINSKIADAGDKSSAQLLQIKTEIKSIVEKLKLDLESRENKLNDNFDTIDERLTNIDNDLQLHKMGEVQLASKPLDYSPQRDISPPPEPVSHDTDIPMQEESQDLFISNKPEEIPLSVSPEDTFNAPETISSFDDTSEHFNEVNTAGSAPIVEPYAGTDRGAMDSEEIQPGQDEKKSAPEEEENFPSSGDLMAGIDNMFSLE